MYKKSNNKGDFKSSNNFTRKSNNRNKNTGKNFRSRNSSGRRFGSRKRSVFNDITKFINKSNNKEVKEVEEIYTPENTFQNLKIDERLKKNILEAGYITPTMIQDKSINSILEGKDLVGIANTGTGKTAAFLLPLIDKVLKNNPPSHKASARQEREMVIIIAPTRELAVQIDNEFKKFTKGLKL